VQVRHGYLVNTLRSLDPADTCIIFTSTCRSCAEIDVMLRELDFRCVALHSQVPRES
jgi:superfamily II DNA/RNA helicase